MRLFNRLSATLTAVVDRAVGSMENHDAVVEAAIQTVRRSAGQIRARLNRVRADAATMRSRIDALNAQQGQWSSRAKAPQLDEQTALECLRRRRVCLAQAEQLEVALQQQQSLEERLCENITRVEARLDSLKQQRSALQSRQAAAEALRATNSDSASASMVDIDATLERWDATIAAAEIDTEHFDPGDSFERQFLRDEESASLRAELAELKSQED